MRTLARKSLNLVLRSVADIIPAKSPVTVITAGFNHYARAHELALMVKIAIIPKTLLFI